MHHAAVVFNGFGAEEGHRRTVLRQKRVKQNPKRPFGYKYRVAYGQPGALLPL